jgi:hypothetical protein
MSEVKVGTNGAWYGKEGSQRGRAMAAVVTHLLSDGQVEVLVYPSWIVDRHSQAYHTVAPIGTAPGEFSPHA